MQIYTLTLFPQLLLDEWGNLIDECICFVCVNVCIFVAYKKGKNIMKTTIKIHGQINGNFNLRNKLSNYTEVREGRFNSFYVDYNTKADAQRDLSKAFNSLKDECWDKSQFRDRIYKDKGGRAYMIMHDASYAEIIENN
jgi:hypothetical protein